MQWYLLKDQHGTYFLIPYAAYSPIKYIMSAATDGTQPINMYLECGLTFVITGAQLNAIVGALPTVQNVTNVT